MAVIEVQHLRKVYGATIAVDDVSFQVEEGEIFGMVGPNGAGKTTTIECIEGLRQPDRGEIIVLGQRPAANNYALKARIGVQLQESALHPRLRVWEALDLFTSFYPHTIDWEPMLERFGLAEKRNTYFDKLSGGQKQRLFILLALLNDPDLVFLDELTTGLDPQARRSMWDMVRQIREQGKTIFLTTHFMDEAQNLCDRVAIMDQGKIIALDTVPNLIRNLNAEVQVSFQPMGDFEPSWLNTLPGVTRVEQFPERVVVHGKGDNLLSDVVSALGRADAKFNHLQSRQPNLEDVFLALTGREMRD